MGLESPNPVRYDRNRNPNNPKLSSIRHGSNAVGFTELSLRVRVMKLDVYGQVRVRVKSGADRPICDSSFRGKQVPGEQLSCLHGRRDRQ